MIVKYNNVLNQKLYIYMNVHNLNTRKQKENQITVRRHSRFFRWLRILL